MPGSFRRSVHGKDTKKIRCAVQDKALRDGQRRHDDGIGGMPRISAVAERGGPLADSLRRGTPQWECQQSRKGIGAREREVESEGRRADDADRHIKKNRRLETTSDKRRFVDHHRGESGTISAACKAAGIPVSTYYYKERKDPMMQAEADAELRDQIEKVQAEFPFYGYRRVHEHLERHCGVTVNKKRLQRVMRENGLRALIWRGFKVKTTDSEHDHGFAPNLLPGHTIDRPNQVWVADITYIRIRTGFVYLAAVLDLFTRSIAGWAISQRINHKLCLVSCCAETSHRGTAPCAGMYSSLRQRLAICPP